MRKYLVVFVCVCLAMMAGMAHAGDAEFMDLLNILRDNGTITQQQFDKLQQALESKSAETETDTSDDVAVKTKGGVEVSTYDGNFSFELGGRLMIDAAFYHEDKNTLGDGTEIRRARIDLEGRLFADWDYEFGIDFADGDADIKDAYISYNGFWPIRLTVGQFKAPFSLEEQTNSKYITFMERALVNEFAPGYNIGVGIYGSGDMWTAAAGAFGEAFDDDAKDEGDEGWNVTGRLTFAPVHTDTRALHLGAAVSYQEPDDEKEVKFDTRPESHVTELKYVDTGKIKSTDHLIKYGLEASAVYGPFSLQGEYIFTDIQREDGSPDVEFHGGYVYGSWFLTGESRAYKFQKGAFGRVEPRGKWGALELAARYSTIDLNDGPIAGGIEKNITFGLNWYINPQIRFMANYIIVDNDEHADADGEAFGDDSPDIFQMRFQADF